MLTLYKDSRAIVTGLDFSARFTWRNPACFIDEMPGSIAIDISLPVNEYTMSEFGHPDRFEKLTSTNDRKFSDVSIRFGSVLLLAGTLIIKSANDENYSCWLQSHLGAMGTAQRDKFITELPWKSGVNFVNKSAYVPGVDDYACIPVSNPAFWNGKGRETTVQIPYIDENGQEATKDEQMTVLTDVFRRIKLNFVNKLANDLTVDASGEACVVSPFLFLNYAVKEMLRLNGFFVDESANVLADPDFQLLIYNNYNIFQQSFNTELRAESHWDYELNDMVDDSIFEIMSTEWTPGQFSYKDLLPKISVKDFILHLQNHLNIVFVFKNDKTVQILNRNDLHLQQAYDLDRYMIGRWNMGEMKDVTLKFIQENDGTDSIYDDWHDLSDRREDYKDPVATIEELNALQGMKIGDLRVVESENRVYEYKWADFSGEDAQRFEKPIDVLQWTAVSIMPQPHLYGSGDSIMEIKTGSSTLNFSDSKLKTRQPGNISSMRSLWSDFTLRLMMHDKAGLYQNLLKFAGEYGLFNTRWKKWADFRKSTLPAEAKFNVPQNELYYLINHISDPYSTRHGKFIIEEMSCDFEGDTMGPLTISGYKV